MNLAHKKVLLFFGTRPEAIKMAPVAVMLRSQGVNVEIGLSGQHRDMVLPILDFFGLRADFNLGISYQCKNIEDALAYGVQGLSGRLREHPVDLILVHGDTSTTLAGAMAGFYQSIPVAHVEAGLRSGSMEHPFPEEANRKLTASLSSLHFAPTTQAAENLRREGVPETHISITGNTVIDAVLLADRILKSDSYRSTKIASKFSFLDPSMKWILLTGHRRENLNESMPKVVNAVRDLAIKSDAQVLFPVHPNPKIAQLIAEIPQGDKHLITIPPVSYEEMIWLYSKVSLIVTDSGGIQEEAANYSIPVLVTRKVTERKESLGLGLSHLVGDNRELIISLGLRHLFLTTEREKQSLVNPYGDGLACARIARDVGRILGFPLTEPIDLSAFQAREQALGADIAGGHSN